VKKLDITARITGIKYSPFMCRKLNTFNISDLDGALSSEAIFILNIDNENKIAVSWWVSAKRTRSYPYTRVYDSLSFSGKKVTIIPMIKDEGLDGDRDFLQWDTVSLMSLLGIYVIISYYKDAVKNPQYKNKITEQRYDTQYIRDEIKKLMSYQSDALHWNLSQLDKAGEIAEKSLEAYSEISKRLEVEMRSISSARDRIRELLQGKDTFLKMSRDLAKQAQARETVTKQPKEKLEGEKATITITNYLGGKYFFTCDEVELHGNDIFLIEGKHTKTSDLPSLNDIKDGLLKMILLTNLKDVRVNETTYNPKPILKLTTQSFITEFVFQLKKTILADLKKEAQTNTFQVLVNSQYL
jgi:hypothetical protein